MTRVEPRCLSHKISKPRRANLYSFLLIIALTLLVLLTYFIVKKPIDYLEDPTDQYVMKNIPKIYTKLEGIDPEEREVFEGFRTSFLPREEIVMTRSHSNAKRHVYEANVNSDIFIWDDSIHQHSRPERVKRKSNFAYTYQDYDPLNITEEDVVRVNEKYINKNDDEEYDMNSTMDDSDIEVGTVESIVQSEMHVDRGPFDDVVEQIRGQPELEEEEMGIAANVYKPSKPYTGIHAFWKGQGDKETIRATQANIMRQYMDADADPCHDFYQYACGNWPTLNPIPADKAGYDTFEMLRENLDTVLKDLLEFKNNEKIESIYPGAHLDLKYTFLKNIIPYKSPTDKIEDESLYLDIIDDNSRDILNKTAIEEHRYELTNKDDKTEMIERIRRYLDKNSKPLLKPLNDIKSKVHHHLCKKENLTRNKRQSDIKSKSFPIKNLLKIETTTSQTKDKDLKVNLLKSRYNIKQTKREATVGEKPIHDNMPKDDLSYGDATLKARFLFKSCMNYEILQKRAHRPLLDLLDILGGWPLLNPKWKPDHFDWLEQMAKLRLYNNDILISEWVGPDIKNSDEFVIQFDQTSLGLPTRDYFLQSANRVYLNAYKTYLLKIGLLLGGDPDYVKINADELIEFETKLAKITSAPEDRRNVSELYKRMPLHKLEELVPQVKWKKYLTIVMNRTIQSNETVVLFALNYVRHLVKLIEHTKPSTLSNYLLWRFVRHRVNNLDDRFQSAKQQFYFILFGREQAPPRWKNCISQVNSNMGMALGSMFVKKYFDEMSKNDTLTMTREIQQSFEELLHLTDWIDDQTKQLAASKVDVMMLRIGYPDFILNKIELDDRYKEVQIHPDKYFENILNILQHLTKMEQSRISQPVNKTLWNTAPAVVNAYYSRNKNQIMFPAGILQPPFYHQHFPRSLNYGGIGVVIGHEITHGFDDKGRLFDSEGNLHRWWSDTSIEAFHRRAQCLIDQYSQYKVPEINMNIDGVNTQGENIADNGGVKQAFRAYLHWLQQHGADGETLPGLNHTHKQLFFLNFAQVWCGAMRPEAMRNKLKTAVHSPGRFRVIGTLSNSHDFAREFRCPPGSPMNPTHKCTVW
ncbi:hypothetical protein ACJJTC_013020 [Scirpophaga incertulas]